MDLPTLATFNTQQVPLGAFPALNVILQLPLETRAATQWSQLAPGRRVGGTMAHHTVRHQLEKGLEHVGSFLRFSSATWVAGEEPLQAPRGPQASGAQASRSEVYTSHFGGNMPTCLSCRWAVIQVDASPWSQCRGKTKSPEI